MSIIARTTRHAGTTTVTLVRRTIGFTVVVRCEGRIELHHNFGTLNVAECYYEAMGDNLCD